MAKVLGSAGRYTANESLRKTRRQFIILISMVVICCTAFGFLIGARISGGYLFLPVIPGLLVLLSRRLIDKRIDALEKLRLNYESGDRGEKWVGKLLEKLPDTYYVINDLSTDYGNIDHVVIGPTGVFMIDTKNWRGCITATREGELLLNDKPTDKPQVSYFIIRVMKIRDRLMVLCKNEFYLQPLFVFTSAYLKVKWGETKKLNCITDENLYTYITEQKNKLNDSLIDECRRGFEALARMDKDFENKKAVAQES